MSEPATEILSLAADFPPATRDQWLELVTRLLKGAPFERQLVAKTYDGLTVQPLYVGTAQGRPRIGRSASCPWGILQRVDHPDAAAANAEARHDCENGATGLSLVITGSIGAHGYGVAADETIAQVLDGIALGSGGVALDVDAGPDGGDAALAIAGLIRRRGIGTGSTIRFGLDPIGAMAISDATVSWREAATGLSRCIAELAAAGFKGPFAVADGRLVHNAGGSETQELGFALAVATAYLRALEAGGIALDQARAMIFFRLTADADQFLTMAKFRALRRLWARVEAACGLAPASTYIAGETAWRMMSRRDPYVNMLRATIAVFSAGLGGADAITVLPFTLGRGLPDRFARRIARNTQLVLVAESNLARVDDAAAGAGVIENLTDQLCASAWALFQEIERAGGVAAALEQGLIQNKVALVRGQRQAALARRTDTLIGTSDFADLDESDVTVLDVAAPTVPSRQGLKLVALAPIRLAEPYERLRDASDRMLAQDGSRPRIFLATLGAPADFTPRANFACNFFAAGGIAAITNDGFARPSVASAETKTDLAALTAAFKSSGSELVCLCGSDETYAREAIAAAHMLTGAGASHIYYAGRPAHAAELRAAGVETFIHVGCDAVAILGTAQEQITALRR